MISILIPTYNYDITTLVTRLVEQLEQSKVAFEILVLDDASTNQEIKIKNKEISSFENCFLIENAENQGRTATRQALAEKANNQWLLFMDADVLPKNNDFIKKFDVENQISDVVFGGISYEEQKPEKEKVLRWKYGKAREAKPVAERKKMPHLSIISQCFLIQKKVFLQANDFHDNVYGVDVLFAQNLEKMKTTVQHIDNPIVHLGLESSAQFIEKSKKGLQSLYRFEKETKITNDYRPIQKAYRSLERNKLDSFFMKSMQLFEKSIFKNLQSSNPSLFLFDLYRLYFFTKLHHTKA
ncbi:glycosyltransferase family 2 protein [Planktosalinus lacus]|uniref:Glycosyl transferase n=1 Tax=Planktosalinus lacus TaxID=1526573 RepID=A0A8J2Y981_9FLAO|nr:glycosyltransferase family 2 protein [Planktosalinus lacus]GGD85406.1 glycosyl transferase [Planktosalinus lacus]